MTRLALVERENKRKRLREKFHEKRQSLLATINDSSKSHDEQMQARLKLQKLPVNSSPVRARNRCSLTGRPRGTFRKFGLARNKLRELAMSGNIPGITKASW